MDIKKPLVAILAAASLGTAFADQNTSKVNPILAVSNNQEQFEEQYKPMFDKLCSAYRNGIIQDRDQLLIEELTKMPNSVYNDGERLLFTTYGVEEEYKKLEFLYICPKNK